MKEQLQREFELNAHQSLWKQLKEAFIVPSNRYHLLLGMAFMWLQNLSGINALNYYSAMIFKSVGFTGTNVGLLATGVFGIVKAFATMIFMVLLSIGLDGESHYSLGLPVRSLPCSTLAAIPRFRIPLVELPNRMQELTLL